MQTLPEGTRVRIRCPILAVWFLLMGAPASGVAQDTVVTATMLRVVAERADQYRTGRPVYLLADYRFPHNVRGPFSTRRAAELAGGDSSASFRVFGPYVTPRDATPDSAARVVSIQLVVQSPRGRQTIDVNPSTVDALFFSMVPFDKFVVPYYSRLYGPEFARRLRDDALSLPIFIPAHCATHACMPGPEGFRDLPEFDPGMWRRHPADSTLR